MMPCGTVGTGCFHIKYFKKKTYPKVAYKLRHQIPPKC
jgi:hypothetical protein